jgi:hypothetical protein
VASRTCPDGKSVGQGIAAQRAIGAIPGAVLQLLLFFLLPALMLALGPVGGIILGALLIGLTVMLCNFVCTHLINKASGAINQSMGWDEALKDLKKRIKEPPKRIREKYAKKIASLPQPENNANSSQPKLSTQPEAEVAQPVAAGDAQGLSG